jgi:hypothetical protein
VDVDLERAKERLRASLRRRDVRIGMGGAIAGFILGELGSGKVREDLGFKGTRSSVVGEELARKMAKIVDRHGTAAMAGVAFLTGNPELALGGLGVTVGLAAAEVHRDAGPIRMPSLKGRVAGTSEPLLTRAWRAQRVDIDDATPTDEKFRILGDLINQLIVEGSKDPLVVEKANEACQYVDGSVKSYADAVGNWVLDHTKYSYDEDMDIYKEGGEVTPEPNGSLEIFQEAAQSIISGIRDCDCATILIGAMLRSQGIQSLVRMVSQDPLKPDDYTHVYPLVELEDGSEYAIDTTPVKTPFGFVQHPIGWECDRASSMTVLLEPLTRR